MEADGPARHAGRADRHAAGDAADRAVVDLAADPVRRHRRGGARRLGLRRRSSAASSIWCRRRWAGRPISAHARPRPGRQFRRAGLHGHHRRHPHGDPHLGDASAHLHPRHRRRPRHRLGGDRAGGEPHPQSVRQPARLGDGLDHRGAEHPRPARRHRGRARRARHRDRRPARHAAAGAQDRGAAGGGAVGGDRDEQFPRSPRAARRGADAVDPGAARQAHPHRRDDRRDRHRAERGRHRPLGAGGLHRRDRRRRRPRHAEDRVELRQRHHPAGRQVDQAGRRHHRRRPFRLGRQHGRALHLGRHEGRPRAAGAERGPGHPARHQLDLFVRPDAPRSEVQHHLRQRPAQDPRGRGPGRAERRAGAEGAAAGLPPDRIRLDARSNTCCGSGSRTPPPARPACAPP